MAPGTNIVKIYNRFKPSEAIFRCPACHTDMKFRNENSLVCLKNHCFDLSKHGYINFVPNQGKMKYTKDLFESRRHIFKSGFYDPLIKRIESCVYEHLGMDPQTNILDVGCGEGFFISNLFGSDKRIGGIFGLDIFKDAVVLAAKGNSAVNWIVGDLSNIPLRSDTMGLLLNIFSPANYGEFSRIMADSGILIKVIPGKHYLKELRECVKEKFIKPDYSNEQVVKYFSKSMLSLDGSNLCYQLPVNNYDLDNFIKMTPMMFNVDIDKIDLHNVNQITIDVEIMIGKKQI